MPGPYTDNIRILHAGRDRRRRAPAAPPVGRCPAGETPEVRAAWRAFVQELPSLAQSDRAALLSLCRVKVLADRAARAVEASGMVQAGSKGQRTTAAEVRVFMTITESLMRALGRFGGTPVRRASVPPVAEPREPGGEADLLT